MVSLTAMEMAAAQRQKAGNVRWPEGEMILKSPGNADAEPCGEQYHGESSRAATLHALVAIGVLLVGRFAACFYTDHHNPGY